MRSPLFLLLAYLLICLFIDPISAATERKFSPNGNSASAVSRYFVALLRHSLLGHLAADFATRVSRRVHVDVKLAGSEVGGLGIGQRG